MPDHEFFHFTSNGFHYWEYPFLDQSKKVFKFHYWINETGLCLTDCNGENPRDLMMTIDNDLLKMTGPHKYTSWLKRINQADRPLYLSHYYEPIADT